MTTYLFEGVVYPERAQLSLQVSLRFSHVTSGVTAQAHVSIVLNQVAVWVDTDIEWDIYDLRNVVKNILLNQLALVGYLVGYAYDVEVKRVLNRDLQVDYVYGIEIPCISERDKSIDLNSRIAELRQKTVGAEGTLLYRCFNDLVSAMKHPDDTGFYCYRAIESLRQHCIQKHKLNPKNKSATWAKLRELARCDEGTVNEIKAFADPVRHGDITTITSVNRTRLFTITWDIVDGYLTNA